MVSVAKTVANIKADNPTRYLALFYASRFLPSPFKIPNDQSPTPFLPKICGLKQSKSFDEGSIDSAILKSNNLVSLLS